MEVTQRAPFGLSLFCTRDWEYWLTRCTLVYDICIEEYSPHRVIRQFGRFQVFPLPLTRTVPLELHSMTRRGAWPTTNFKQKVMAYVAAWENALKDIVEEDRPHFDHSTQSTYGGSYLAHGSRSCSRLRSLRPTWRPSVTRFLAHVEQQHLFERETLRQMEADLTIHCERMRTGVGVSPHEMASFLDRMIEKARKALRIVTCRRSTEDVFTGPRVPVSPSVTPAITATVTCTMIAPPSAPPVPTMFTASFSSSSSGPTHADVGASASHVSFPDFTDAGFDLDFMHASIPSYTDLLRSSEEIGPSHQPDALAATQPSQDDYTTPPPATRGGRPILPLDPLTYSSGHVRVHRCRAPRPGEVRGVVPKRGRF